MVIKDKSGHLLTLKEAAQLLHIHVNTLRRWSDRGSIHAYRINRRGDRRFRLEDINRFLTQLDTYKGKEEKDNKIEYQLIEFRSVEVLHKDGTLFHVV